jgi:subtilisin family serine protease
MIPSTLFVSLLAAASGALSARTGLKPSKMRVPGAFIFELEDGQNADAFYDEVQAKGSTRMKLDYKLFKGVSVQLDDVDQADAKAARIAALPAVKNMWPVEVYSIPDDVVKSVGGHGAAAVLDKRAKGNDTGDVFSPHVMTQVDKLRAKGFTGKGIKIAVIDTGIDYKHPALGGCFGAGCHVAFGTDLVGDNYDGFNTPVPDDDPMDCQGHGTHVAGIVAAKENEFGFTGTAPDAVLGAYRVFGCDGQAANDVLIAAYQTAFEDGADIITASIGGASGWTEEPWAVAVSRIVEQGVPCTVSAGNDGATGQFYASTAANGKKVTAIASFDNTESPSLLVRSNYTVDAGSAETFGYTPGDPDAWEGVSLPLWAPSFDTSVPDGGCDAYPADTPDLSGFIVLVRRGSCTFVQKAQNAADKGAKYFLVYNNEPGASEISVSAVPGILAAGMVLPDTGEAWIAALEAGSEVELNMSGLNGAQFILSVSDNPKTGGALSDYTSWGPTYEMDVKPQFGAPGGNILSTYPLAKGGYAILSGTSMACPQAAGVYALIAEVRGTFDPELIENLLSATSNAQLFNDASQFYDFLAPVPQQGAGLIQAYDAAYATTLLQPSSLSFNDTEHFAESLNFTLSNTGSKEISYDISHVPAYTFYTLDAEGGITPMQFPNDATDAVATVKFSESKVTLGAGKSVTVEVLPTPPEGVDAKRLALWSGFVAINGTDGTSLSLPYQGLTGSLREAKTKSDEGDTWMTRSDDDVNWRPVSSNYTFTIPGPGETASNTTVFPTLAVFLSLGSPKMIVDVVPLTTCPPGWVTEVRGIKTIGQPEGAPFVYLPRGLNPFDFTGKLDNGKYVPEGKFKLVVRTLRIFGDESNEEDWDVSETDPFRIKYAD